MTTHQTGHVPDHWDGWHWAHCPEENCYWVRREKTRARAKIALATHQKEAHHDHP